MDSTIRRSHQLRFRERELWIQGRKISVGIRLAIYDWLSWGSGMTVLGIAPRAQAGPVSLMPGSVNRVGDKSRSRRSVKDRTRSRVLSV